MDRRCRLRASLTLAKPEVGVALPHDFVARLIAFRDDAVSFPMFGNDIAYLWEAFIGRYLPFPPTGLVSWASPLLAFGDCCAACLLAGRAAGLLPCRLKAHTLTDALASVEPYAGD